VICQVSNAERIEDDVIRLYDGSETLFYCDPPYLHETRDNSKAYGFEMDQRQHRELAMSLHLISGKAAVSRDRCALMDKLRRFVGLNAARA
jgi:DNA adenine methylase